MSADQYPEVSDDDAGIVPPQSGRGSEWPKKIRTLTAAELDRLTIDAAGRFYWDGRLVNYEPPAPPKPVEEEPAEGPAVDALDRSAMDILERAALELSDRTPIEPLDEQATAARAAVDDTAATKDAVTAEEQLSHGPDTDEARPSEVSHAVDFDALAAPDAAVAPRAHASTTAAEMAPTVDMTTYDQVAAPVAETIRLPADRVRVALTGGQSFALVLLLLALLIGASGVAISGFVTAHEWSCRVGLITHYCPPPAQEAPKPPIRSDIPA